MCVSKDIAKRSLSELCPNDLPASQNKQKELSLCVSSELGKRSVTELDMTKELGWHLLVQVRITQN